MKRIGATAALVLLSSTLALAQTTPTTGGIKPEHGRCRKSKYAINKCASSIKQRHRGTTADSKPEQFARPFQSQQSSRPE